MKEIVCLSNEPWSTAPGRTQQLVSRLRDTRVLYFYPAFPQSLDWRRPGRKVRPNVTVFALPPVPEWTLRFPHLFLFAQHRLARLISGQVQRRRFRAPLLWTSHPAHVHLLDQLEYDGLVYDCDREWGRLPSRWEGALAHAADVVFAASPGLRQRLSPCSENIALLPNGVSFPLFSRGDLGGTQPLFPGLRGPLLGWAGTLHADLDLSPLLYAARSCPDWTFLLLGRQEEGSPWPDRLRRLPNVILRGPCPLLDVPGYLYRCDVLLNFLRAPQDHSDIVPVHRKARCFHALARPGGAVPRRRLRGLQPGGAGGHVRPGPAGGPGLGGGPPPGLRPGRRLVGAQRRGGPHPGDGGPAVAAKRQRPALPSAFSLWKHTNFRPPLAKPGRIR